jgi:hypothetical protein
LGRSRKSVALAGSNNFCPASIIKLAFPAQCLTRTPSSFSRQCVPRGPPASAS